MTEEIIKEKFDKAFKKNFPEAVIINGVNVAGCNFRLERDNKQKCECCHATGFGVICDCEAWHNCYYKQLQGIKQQNLELIERANAYPKIVILANERLNEIARLEQENKELKTKLDVFAFTISQYESALEEIKNSVINYLPKENYKFAKSFNPEQFELFENILTKINEVLGDN